MPQSRTLTVVVADVVGSTELFDRLGVERADDARRALFAAFNASAKAGGGTLVKTMGDGCLASFGSAADAVTSAIALQHAAARLRERKVPGLGLGGGVRAGQQLQCVVDSGDEGPDLRLRQRSGGLYRARDDPVSGAGGDMGRAGPTG